MIVSMIVAVGDNGVIGREGKIPWKLPHDLRRFKQLTMGKAVIMGRKTFESLSGPLSGRVNVIITKQNDFNVPKCLVTDSLPAALDLLERMDHKEVFVIGGDGVYREAMQFASVAYITKVHITESGDAFFPVGEVERNWHKISQIMDNRRHGDPVSEFAVYIKPKSAP